LRRVSSALNQARLAFDKRLAKRAALLIVEFNLQTTIPAEGVCQAPFWAEKSGAMKSMI
jgi:hypothetical protein